MDAEPSLHPADRALRVFGLGKLDVRSAEAVNEHLMECSDCRKRIAEMPADSFLERVRAAQKFSEKAHADPLPARAGGTDSDTVADTDPFGHHPKETWS